MKFGDSAHRKKNKKITLLSWSSGKDCAWALHLLRQQPDIEVVGLFCTVNQEFSRVAMHAVRIRASSAAGRECWFTDSYNKHSSSL